MTKMWYPVIPGQPRSNVGWDFPAKRAEIKMSAKDSLSPETKR